MLDEEVPAGAVKEKDGAMGLVLGLLEALKDSHAGDGVIALWDFVSKGKYKMAGQGNDKT